MDIYIKIEHGHFKTKTIPKFERKCANGHFISTTSNFNYCPECGIEFKEYNKKCKEDYKKLKKEIDEENLTTHKIFKAEALDYCGILGHKKAEQAFLMAWDRGHSSGLTSVVNELEDLASLMS